MEKISGAEVCEIIKTCRTSKVAWFKLGGLEMEFSEHVAKQKKKKEVDYAALDEANQLELNLAGAEELTADEIKDDEAYMSQLAIEDPAAWEKAMTEGEE